MMTCNKCLKEYPEALEYYGNSSKMLHFCKTCFESQSYFKEKDQNLLKGWELIQPERSKREDDYDDCSCNCHD